MRKRQEKRKHIQLGFSLSGPDQDFIVNMKNETQVTHEQLVKELLNNEVRNKMIKIALKNALTRTQRGKHINDQFRRHIHFVLYYFNVITGIQYCLDVPFYIVIKFNVCLGFF